MWIMYSTSINNTGKIGKVLRSGFEPFSVSGDHPETIWFKKEVEEKDVADAVQDKRPDTE